MSDDTKRFDPSKHLISLRNRSGGSSDYLPVAARIAWFRSEHPDGDIDVTEHTISEQIAVFRARVTIPGGGAATGWGTETPADFRDYIEKASTKSVGRALLALGYGALQAGDELDEGARLADAPVERPQRPRERRNAPPPTADTPQRQLRDEQRARQTPQAEPRPPAPTSAASSPNSGAATTDDGAEEQPAESWGWTEAWSFLRSRGYSDKAMVERALGRPMQGMSPYQVCAAIAQSAVAL